MALAALAVCFTGGPARYVCACLTALFLAVSALAELRIPTLPPPANGRSRGLRFSVLMALTLYAVVYMFLVLGEGGIRSERLLLFGIAVLWAGDGLLSRARPGFLRSFFVHLAVILATLFVLELCAGVYNSRMKIKSLYSHQMAGPSAGGPYDPWLGVPVARMEEEPFFLWLPELGAVFYPGRKEGAVRTNDLGMRDVKEVGPKEPGEVRILCLGASTTAQGLDSEKTYPAYLEKELNEGEDPARFTVWNGAVPGWTIKTSLLHYISRYDVLEPEIIIVYHGINDLRIAAKASWPYYPVSEAVSNPPPLAELAKGVIRSSELGRLLQSRLSPLLSSRGGRREGKAPGDEVESLQLKQFRETARLLAAAARERGALVVFVGFETALGEGGAYTDEEREKLQKYALAWSGGKDPDLSMLKEMGRALEGLQDGETVFYLPSDGFVPKSSKFYYDLFHRTDRGRRAFAAKLASELRGKVIQKVPAGNRPRTSRPCDAGSAE